MKTGVNRCIKIAMAERGLNQVHLAEIMGVSPGQISNILVNDNCELITLMKICKALDISASDLLKLGDL